MPELPEVQSVVDSLVPHLPGARIVQVEVRRRDVISIHKFTRNQPTAFELPAAITGRTVVSVSRRAKRIVVALDDGAHFYIHLGMTGALTVNPATEALHTHLVLRLTAGRTNLTLHFSDPRRFGKLVYLPKGVAIDKDVGPEPLTLSAKDLHTLLQSSRRPIKAALLDQKLIAGLGNIYVDESLHAAGIHPVRRTDTLVFSEVKLLSSRIKSILRRAIKLKGSTLRDYRDANGAKGSFQQRHKVYDREGEPCRTCETPIKRMVHANRGTHYCPTCQVLKSK